MSKIVRTINVTSIWYSPIERNESERRAGKHEKGLQMFGFFMSDYIYGYDEEQDREVIIGRVDHNGGESTIYKCLDRGFVPKKYAERCDPLSEEGWKRQREMRAERDDVPWELVCKARFDEWGDEGRYAGLFEVEKDGGLLPKLQFWTEPEEGCENEVFVATLHNLPFVLGTIDLNTFSLYRGLFGEDVDIDQQFNAQEFVVVSCAVLLGLLEGEGTPSELADDYISAAIECEETRRRNRG